MPVCSYLVQPRPGCKESVREKLINIKGCEVIPASNREVMILMTDTSTDAEEQALQVALKAIDEIQSITMTFGNIESTPNEESEHAEQ